MKTETMERHRIISASLWAFLCSLLLTVLVFAEWMPAHFFGDDLANIWDYMQGSFPSDLVQAFTQTPSHKYRPVFHWVLGELFGLFGDSIKAYLFFNVLLHALIGALVFRLAWQLAGWSFAIASGVAVVVVMARFGLYHVTQVTGLVEGLAFALFLLSLHFLSSASQADHRWRDVYVVLAALAALMAVASHERYLVYVAWVALVLLLRPALVGHPRARLMTGAGLVSALPVYFLVRNYLLGNAGLLGTDGKALAFDSARAADHAGQALLSLSGYNHGPDYLIGASASSISSILLYVAIAIAACWVGCLLLSVIGVARASLEEKAQSRYRLEWAVALVVLAGVMLVPMLLTVRLEQRWLVQPFALIVLAFAVALSVGLTRHRHLAVLLGVVFFSLQALSNSLYSARLERVSFVYAGRFAAEVDAMARGAGLPRSIAIVGAAEHCEWTLRRGDFFRLRYGLAVEVRCFADVKELVSAPLPELTMVLRQTKLEGGLVDVTDEWKEERHRANERVIKDLVERFSDGQVNNNQGVDSPSGRGSMLATWESPLGPRPTVTVVSGFAHVYSNVTIAAPARVRALAAMVYPSKAGTTAVLRVRHATRPALVVSVPLQPRAAAGAWAQAPMDLAIDVAGTYTIELEVRTDAGVDSSGHWVAFMNPRVVEVVANRAQP